MKQADGKIHVDVIDRLPTPVRARALRRRARPHVDQVDRPLPAAGAGAPRRPVPRRRGVRLRRHRSRSCWAATTRWSTRPARRSTGSSACPGEELPGSVAATDFVTWYCGHPDASGSTFDRRRDVRRRHRRRQRRGRRGADPRRDRRRAAGHRRARSRRSTRSAAAGVAEIHMIGRRGPGAGQVHHQGAARARRADQRRGARRPEELTLRLDPASAALAEADRHVRGNVDGPARLGRTRGPAGRPRRLDLRFWLRPVGDPR